MASDFTLLIHGPISIYTILTLYRYREEYPIILVTPKPKDDSAIALLTEVQQITNDVNYKINLLVYDFEVNEKYNNHQNRYLHFFSVAFGLEICKSPYVIKLRSDEFYSKLKPFTDAVRRNNNKITTNDVFFRKQKTYPLHPSDHLMGGKTGLLKDIFDLAKQYCEDDTLLKANPFTKSAMAKVDSELKLAAEQILGLTTLITLIKDKKFNTLDEVEIMRQSFEIVSSDKLGFFRIGANSQKVKEFFDTSYFNSDSDINNILDYGEDTKS